MSLIFNWAAIIIAFAPVVAPHSLDVLFFVALRYVFAF